jgi:hypothetical protein
VSSVVPVFVAFVAVVAVVEEVALPLKAPTKVVDVTEVRPANVVDDEPNEIAVVPTVMLEFVRAELGILVKPAPEPEN